MTTAYGSNRALLEGDANRFLCVLYFLARSIMDRSFNSDNIFTKLGLEGYSDKEQARAEIVQFLQQQQKIKYDRTNNTVSLDNEGLNWAKRNCDKPPYLQYKQ